MSFVRKNPSAGGIVYDNSVSGLDATTLQQAVDELSAGGGTDLIKAICHNRNSAGFPLKLYCPELNVYLNAQPQLIFTKSGQVVRMN